MQLNDVDRDAAGKQSAGANDGDRLCRAPVVASSHDSSTWDQTSLIGKIFIGFGVLLTMASAARMFMA